MKTTAALFVVLLFLAPSWLEAQPDATDKLAGRTSITWTNPGVSLPNSGDEVRMRIQGEVDKRLKALGYAVRSTGKPDFYVAYHLLSKPPRATLVIDIVDAGTGHLIWRSLDSDLSARSLWSARFADYETYAWKQIGGLDETPLYESSDRLLRAALEEEIFARGYEFTEGSEAQMRLAYHVVGDGANVRRPFQGKLAVELTAAESTEVLWQGQLSTVIGDPEDREKQIRAVMKKICQDFPTRK